MANNNLSNNENILVKVDQNNLIYIDPNSVVDANGNIQPRGVNPENLVIFANLEADIIPRSILAAGNDQNTLVSIAKGTLNFLSNQDGRDFDSSWTDAFTNNVVKEENQLQNNLKNKNDISPTSLKNYDDSGQSFGIDSITIAIKGANAIPQINITFIDVRGKTLFDAPQNSPYNAFFHIPWPIFYLTLKGYYGKAIRYRLHLVKFSSKFNENNGNFEIQTAFVGSTFAYLNDIPLKAMMNCPYMYLVESETKVNENTDTDTKTVKVSSSSRGYATLKSIYAEYKRKGLVSKDFPNITLRELISKAQSLDKILEKQILNEKLHPDIFVGLQDFENTIKTFNQAVKAWASVNLTNQRGEPIKINNVDVDEYILRASPPTNKLIVGNTEGTLEYIINQWTKKLNESKLFTDELVKAANENKTGGGNFTKQKLFSKNVGNIDKYYNKVNFNVRIDLLIGDIDDITKTFVEQRDKLEANIEEKMNEIIKDKKNGGFGFEPTIRNIFAVILANADVYIRLMKEVHRKAFLKSSERANIEILKKSKETKGDLPIYPWPEVKKDSDNGKSRVIAYPAEKELIKKLKTDDFNLWPEVEFIENFIEVSTNKLDTNTDKEKTIKKITYEFLNDDNESTYNLISALEHVNRIIPYIDVSPSSYLYEIFERANIFTFIDTFDNDILKELANLEFENISDSLVNELEMRVILNDGITSPSVFDDFLKSYSPFERYPYYQDNLPTTKYLQDNLDISHDIREYNSEKRKVNNSDYQKINNKLSNYVPELYRKDVYPFNSDTYLSYLNLPSFKIDELKYNGILEVDPSEGFITTPLSPKSWVKTNLTGNNHLFSNYLTNGTTKSSILNTPYFHNQLYEDFYKTSTYGKYAGSAYLLLNSLPFLDLDDKITFNTSQKTYTPIRMSSMFRNVGATHFIPYHLVCKWGSLYHRYKKFILEGVDILDGSLNINYRTKNIDGKTFFNDQQTGTTYENFTVGSDVISYDSQKDVGVHPFYDAIFHQVVNDYTHYLTQSGDTSFSFNVNKKIILLNKNQQSNNINYWTSFVDNSKYDSNDLRFTLLPSVGGSISVNKVKNPQGQTVFSNETFPEAYQNYLKIIWDDNFISDSYTNRKFPSPNDYFKTFNTNQNLNSLYSVDADYRKLLDLLATFSPNILDDFEDTFLRFATERISNDADSKFPNIKYSNFQNLLKEIVSIKKEANDDTLSFGVLTSKLKLKQNSKLIDITNEILSNENTLKVTFGNPKEMNYHVWHGFSDMDNINTFSFNRYDSSNLTNENKNYIKLYLGEDLDLNYQNFFVVNDVQLSQSNILLFRPLIHIYAGYVKSGKPNNKSSFQNYIRTNVFGLGGAIQRRTVYLTELVKKFQKLPKSQTNVGSKNIVSGYETDGVKLEKYNFFKSFNDKWIGGNSIGQRLLLEEFLFLDKANKDIGSKFFLNIDKLKQLGQQDLDKTNLYSVISLMIQETGVDMRPLPAYINFYGTNYNNKTKIKPSKSVAKDLFGTFLEVDYQDSSPKIILQLVGQSSKHLDMPTKKYKFADDSFYIASTTNNPIIILPEVFNNVDLSKSNRVVAFEVSFGDQNQSIFKGLQLDQTSLKNTSESFVVLENIARSESGAGAYNVDISLFEYYRQASYTCDVTCMGNVMIQPTMYFYLKNIPMFKGSYWITEVNHNIKGNNFTTTFKGARIPYASLPDPKDSFVSSYRVLFDRLRKDTIFKQQASEAGTLSDIRTIKSSDGKSYTVNVGKEYNGEDFDKIVVNRAGVTSQGIPYNGFLLNSTNQVTDIQLVKYTYPNIENKEWLRARVFEFGSDDSRFSINDDETMEIISYIKGQKKLKWSEIKETRKTTNFYSTIVYEPEKNVDKIRKSRTVFVNPVNKKMEVVTSLINTVSDKRVVTGLIDVTVATNFGVGLSNALLKKLNLKQGDIVYFILQ